MAQITFEQYKQLKSQGLSDDQIAKFQSGYVPTNPQNFTGPTNNPGKDLLSALPDTVGEILFGMSKGVASTVSSLLKMSPFSAPISIAGVAPEGEQKQVQSGIQALQDYGNKLNTGWEKVGYGGEKLLEWIAPSSLISKGATAATEAIGSLDALKSHQVLQSALKVLAGSGIEAAGTAGTTYLQTGDVQKAKQAGEITGILSGALRSVGEIARNIGLPEWMMSKVFKDSGADEYARMKSEGLVNYAKENPDKFNELVKLGAVRVGEDGSISVNQTLAQEALARGLSGSLKSMANEVVGKTAELEGQARQIAKGFEGTVDIPQSKSIINILNDTAERYKDFAGGSISNEAEKFATKLTESGGKLNGDDTLFLKRFLDRMRTASSYNQTGITKLSQTQANYKYYSDLVRGTLNKTIPGMDTTMKDYSFYIDALNDLAKKAASEGNKEALGLIDVLFVTEGLGSGVPGMGPVLGLTRRIMNTPMFLTTLANKINSGITGLAGSLTRGVTAETLSPGTPQKKK